MKKFVLVGLFLLSASLCYAYPWGDGILEDILDETEEIEHHFHSKECWFGRHATQAANAWALKDTLGAYQLTAGTAMAYGDTMKILGSSDTPCTAGNRFFDLHEFFLTDASSDSTYAIRFIYGSTNASAAVAAGQSTTSIFRADSTNPQHSPAVTQTVQQIRLPVGTKVWAQIKCKDNSETARILVGIHEYAE